MGYTIAFDIDGTLTNDIQIMKDCIHSWNLHVGHDSTRLVQLNLRSVKLAKFPSFCISEEFWLYTKEIHQRPEISGFTRDAIRGLRVMGCTIILISKRSITNSHVGEMTQSETAKWLHDNGIDYDQLICTNEESKVPYLMKYNCDFIVENDPSILKDLDDHACSTIPILLRKPYNHFVEAYKPNACIWINSVYDLYDVIHKRLMENEGTNFEDHEKEYNREYIETTVD